MKFVSIIMILLYLMLPVACLAHPCSSLGEIAHVDASLDVESDQNTACPVNHDDDDCETTCCCAGHIMASALPEVSLPYQKDRFSLYAPHLALPRIIDRIFVPPQNIA